MTYTEAVAIRTSNLQRMPVPAEQLEEALDVIREAHRPKKRADKGEALPRLNQTERKRLNAALLQHIGYVPPVLESCVDALARELSGGCDAKRRVMQRLPLFTVAVDGVNAVFPGEPNNIGGRKC